MNPAVQPLPTVLGQAHGVVRLWHDVLVDLRHCAVLNNRCRCGQCTNDQRRWVASLSTKTSGLSV